MRLNLFAKKSADAPRPGIQLERAMFCTNCETVSHHIARGGRCPHCESTSIMPLARWIPSQPLVSSIVDPARRPR
jgi:predicted Zn-ribbon and HTH transcriptional regulator